MTFDAIVLHVAPGRMQAQRLDVTFLASGQEWDGYTWISTYRGQLVGTMLHQAAKTREKIQLTTDETVYGVRIVWAQRIEANKTEVA